MADQNLASSATTATCNSGCGYDIFINHRGPDVKKAFASHLRNLFELCGHRAFLDKDALKVGENATSQIEGVIASSRVHIAILSPRYAESKYCLEELHQMLESGAPIIPVFYHVTPDQLRCRRGRGRFARFLRKFPWVTTPKDEIYSEALSRLPYERSTIEKWRQALLRVADIVGFELEQCNWDEGELANKIVKRVEELLGVEELLEEKESRKGMKMWLLRRLCNGGC